MGKITEAMRFGAVTCDAFSTTVASVTNAMCSSAMELARTKLAQETLASYMIPLTSFRVHDAVQTLLPSAGANDDLGLVTGTLGTETSHLSANDLGAAGATTRYARAMVQLPPEYDDAETVNLRVSAACQTAVSDTTCTVDFQAYSADDDLTVSADLVTTAATSMNSVTFANYDFVVTATSLVAGKWLDIRVSMICNDAATAVVEPTIASVYLLCDIRG